MSSVSVALGAVASVSCAQIAGIEEASGSARPVDSVAVTRLSIGATLTQAPLDLGSFTATYFVANAASPTGFDRVMANASATAGMWSTKLYDPAPVEFMLPDVPAPLPRLFSFPSHQLQVLYGVLEHPNPVPAPDGATFTVTAPLDTAITAADSFQTYVVGAWLARNFVAGEFAVGATSIGPVTYGFAAANSVAGRPKPDQVTPADAFLILRYAAGGLTGVAEATGVDQSGAATTVTAPAMVAVPQDQTLDVKIAPAMLMNRYGFVRPAVGSLVMNWNLVAAPGYRTATNAGPSLHNGSLTAAEVGVTLKYGNPFAARGWNAMFVLGTSESRVYTAPGTTASLSLVAGLNQFIEPSPGFQLTLPAGLPILVKVDGALVSSDGQMIKQPSKFVQVTFVTDTPGGASDPSATFYELQVWDLVPNPMVATTLDRHLVLAAASSEARFDLPPDVFQMGHSYTLRAITELGGFPAIGGGNFAMRELPLAQSYLDSPVITVTPP
ncbi:MAG TPA: hypothetical protein VF469_05535 [Kofleriaceae bacterium]